MGLIYANNKIYDFNPTVKDMCLILFADYNKNYELLSDILSKYEIVFSSKEEIECFFTNLNIAMDRFGNYGEEVKIKTFDFFSDSDLIYADFLKTYPAKVKSMQDLQNMGWWEFLILLNNINTSLSDRIGIRNQKTNSKMSTDERVRLNKSKQKVRIIEQIKSEVI